MFHNPDGYTVNENGIIQDPGKFEAELIYLPYFYSCYLDGSATEDIYDGDTLISVFVVEDEDRALFPELLEDVYAVLLWESDQGFCNSREVTEAELDEFRAEVENAEPTEPSEGDITTENHTAFYQDGKRVLWTESRWNGHGEPTDHWYYSTRGDGYGDILGDFGDDHIAALRAYMEKTQYWPNCWFVSDHGNAHLMNLSEDK